MTSRLNNPDKSAIVVVMQRLHATDVAGVILGLGGYVHLCLPMEYEPAIACTTAIGFTDPRTEPGQLLEPTRFSREVCERLRRTMGPYAYAGQYQQQPGPRDGAFFVREWFRRYRTGAQPDHLRVYLTSDHAPTAGPKSDSNGVRVWGIDRRGDIWLLDGRKGRMRMDELSDIIIGNMRDAHRPADRAPTEGLIRKWKPFAWFPESDNNYKAVEPFVLRRMREEGVTCRIEPISPNGPDKATRAQAAQAMAASGRVWIPETSEGDEIIHELIGFPTADHDEDVDLLAIICRAIDMAHPAIVPPDPAKPEAPRGINEMTWDDLLEQQGQQKREWV